MLKMGTLDGARKQNFVAPLPSQTLSPEPEQALFVSGF